jgi:UDP-2-acetamido-2-deoxy-ribo-hexuluronate aminotransferase
MEFIDLKAQQALIRASLEARLHAVLDHGRYIMGPEVAELEERLAHFAGVPHALSVSSGTDALLLALMALGVGPGDEVVTTAFTFVATVETIALLGARPVFVDIEPDTYNLDAALLEAAITPATRAIIAVDLFGQCSDYPQIDQIAARHGIPVISDAAQSFGSSLDGRRAGSFGTIACTSFFPAKPLGCYGDGGACFTHDPALASSMRELRNHGQSALYEYSRVGVNGRMDTMQAAILLAKMDIFEEEIRLRQEVAERYASLLPPSILPPVVRPGRVSAWAQYTIRIDQRDKARETLAAHGIPTGVYYPKPLHHHAPYRQEIHLPVTEAASREVMSLPMHPYLAAEDQQRITAVLAELVAGGTAG